MQRLNTSNVSLGQRSTCQKAATLGCRHQTARTSVLASAASTGTTGRTRTAADLDNPAQIGASGRHTVKVKNFPSPVSLTNYMLLPVEQYFVLDPKQIKHLGGNRFLLIVPRINILNVWLEPEVEVEVTTVAGPSPRVILQAENARIRGSEAIERLRIDQRFCMRFVTELQWSGAPVVSSAASGASFEDEPLASSPGDISGGAHLDVWCEVIPPFNLMPREVLQGTCNVVMQGLVSTLLPLFMSKLGEDYQRWAVDAAYRASRAARQVPLS
mmetsp:Transcript_25137/g.63764  ORF Transcript_25137/g.63764 Transcript_25137/m.63764 type:complete len:271 (-) Transcript_25137:153-965(-)